MVEMLHHGGACIAEAIDGDINHRLIAIEVRVNNGTLFIWSCLGNTLIIIFMVIRCFFCCWLL